jgi:ribosomal protein L20
MARIKGALATRKRRNKVLKLAKGYWGGKSKLFKTAKEAVWKSGQYAYYIKADEDYNIVESYDLFTGKRLA